MLQNRIIQIFLTTWVLVCLVAAIGLRYWSTTEAWAPLFDIAGLLGFVGCTVGWETARKKAAKTS